jgi:hypothetical protein
LTRIKAEAFPELRRVFSGYLHEDFQADGGTPEKALRTFVDEASPAERRQFQREAARFLAQTATLTLDDLHVLLKELGCRWVPPTRDALVKLLKKIES